MKKKLLVILSILMLVCCTLFGATVFGSAEPVIKTPGSLEIKKEYTANVRISEDNLKEVLYYATKCSMSQNGVCLDSFDDEHPYVTSLGNSKGANIKIDERFGFFNNSDVVLFVKVKCVSHALFLCVQITLVVLVGRNLYGYIFYNL